MMNMTEFKNAFVGSCRDELLAIGRMNFEIEECTVRKPQIGELSGLRFTQGNSACAPTLYVEDFYKVYERNCCEGQFAYPAKEAEERDPLVTSLSKEAVRSVMESLKQVDMIPARDFDFISEPGCLRARLLGRAGNEALLDTVPWKDMGDGLVLVAYMESGEFRALVTDALLDASEMSSDELFDIAIVNTSIYEPAVLYELAEAAFDDTGERRNLLDECSEREGSTLDSEKDPVSKCDFPIVLSNSDLFWGASALFYPEVIQRIRALIGGDFYVLPSSVHELVIVPAAAADPLDLAEILYHANRTVVSPADKLSDDLYFCGSDGISRIGSHGSFTEAACLGALPS